jgi:alpha/beta superfamily hydrolase
MDNNVVLGLAAALGHAGLAVLRFNFRGVGESGGEHGGGGPERGDVAAAIAYLGSIPGVDEARLAVVGYSFGAAVGLPAGCADVRVRALVAVAPPLAVLPMEELGSCDKPVLALVGSADGYCPGDAFQRWFACLAGPKEKSILPGADHFLAGREGEVGQTAASFLIRHGLWEGPAPGAGERS